MAENIQPTRKKRNLAGIFSVCLTVAALLLYGVLGTLLLKRLLDRSASYEEVRLLLNGTLVAGVLSGLALICAIVGLCLRRRRKAGAIIGTALSLLLLALTVLILGAYEYTLGALQTDASFRDISDAQLAVLETDADGRIDRKGTSTADMMEIEEIESLTGQRDLVKFLLTADELPAAAQAAMQGEGPIGESYLLPGAEQIQNVLLFGLDEENTADGIILLSIDPVHKKLKLISLNRDTCVLMPQWGRYSRITYAYRWGGAELALRTVNTNFSLNASDYLAVDLSQLTTIIDAMGGVDITLDRAELASMGNPTGLSIGTCRLNGEQAIAFTQVRSSSDNGTAAHTGRQRELVVSILDRLRTMPYTAFPQLVRLCLSQCSTSLENRSLTEICMRVVMDGYSIEQHSIPGDSLPCWNSNINALPYCVYDLNRASDAIYRLIYEELYVSGYPD